MPGTNKIIRLNLQKTVEELISSGVTTSTAIAAVLKEKGYSVSQPTVSRYLKEQREARKEQTQQIINSHVNETVPADLTALETMETQCLVWAKEDNTAFANRLAVKHIVEAAPRWLELILQLAGEEQGKAIKQIIGQCLSWTADDLRLQTARIAAMRQATQIIEMKLRYVLGETGDGKIFFVDRERGDKLVQNATGGLMVIPGGQS
jgi:predicted transcriptional regulator